jgi:DHA1 family multidrug resistance protein-like MFS transporter
MITLIIFVILQVPSALVQNFAGLCVLRFLAGFFGSPPLATGGASLQDMYSIKTRTFALGAWGVAASGGPSLGPIVSGFAIQAHNWRWAFWIMLWLAGGSALFLALTLPEVSIRTNDSLRAQ